jgi:hypothetical protein
LKIFQTNPKIFIRKLNPARDYENFCINDKKGGGSGSFTRQGLKNKMITAALAHAR